VGLILVHNGLNQHHGHLHHMLSYWTGPTWSFFIPISCFVNVISTLFIHNNNLMIFCLWIVLHPYCLMHIYYALIYSIIPIIPIMWWLLSSPLHGCYLTSQIFSGKSEAEIRIRRSKAVNWHCFHVTCIKFEVGMIFLTMYFLKTLFLGLLN